MVSGLKEVYPVGTHEVDDSMFLSEASRPGSRGKKLQWLGLSNARKWITQYSFDQVERSQSDLAFNLNPIPQILAELRMKYCIAGAPHSAPAFISSGQSLSLDGASQRSLVWFGGLRRGSEPGECAEHFWVTVEDGPSRRGSITQTLILALHPQNLVG